MISERRIEVVFVDEAVSGSALLLDSDAPRTCDAFWSALGEPMSLRGVHAMWTGPDVSCSLLGESRRFNGALFPKEKLSSFPQLGDLLWSYVPAYMWPGVHEPICDLGIFYGREGANALSDRLVPGKLGCCRRSWTRSACCRSPEGEDYPAIVYDLDVQSRSRVLVVLI